MSVTTIPQLTLPENRLTPTQGNLSRYVFRTEPYDAADPGPWLWHPTPDYKPDLRTGRHRRGEAPDPVPTPNTSTMPPTPPSDRFEPLREIAWTRFLESSEPLARAHTTQRRPSALRTRLTRALRTLTALLAIRLTHRRVTTSPASSWTDLP